MRKSRWIFTALIFIMLCSTSSAYADVYVDGYFRDDGTYVEPHYRSDPDGLFYNNFSTFGNINPYTGEIGTKRRPDSEYNTFEFPSLDQSEAIDGIDVTSSDQSRNINIAESFISPYDTTDEIEAKTMLVDYFNDINTRSYMPAYNCWITEWQTRHPYDTFEEGYVNVINNLDEINAISNEQEVTLAGTITTQEGWEQTSHRYQYVYNVQEIKGTWKLVHGKLDKLW
ncbi:hypothetical protein [Lentibacillus cibarius]|uniref:DUF4440 domain-containing protein n=1 Tax=Lentibacillus cibarius TaxID=2583219 RepID=A0A5S3R7I9_9BACI|nr:hypothetical protein [Lentibacillus cibarius]TMN21893.1 hypothetical protein FFL34_07025 [Lentibacillus cibarius]